MNSRVGVSRHFAARDSLVIALMFAGSATTFTQTNAAVSAPTSSATPPVYEIISVKPSKPNCDVMSFKSSPGRLSVRCYNLRQLLLVAYSIKPHATVPGMPTWGNSAYFDIDAKADDETLESMQKLSADKLREQTQSMLQALLADRFKLRVHNETREESIYNLVVAKSGFKLREAPEDEREAEYSWGSGRILVHHGPIASLVFCLSDDLTGRTVIDKTGLLGKYEINLKWTADEQQGSPDAGPTLFTALEEQLGLKLVPAKGPVDTFVIDHIEKPSEN